MILVVSKAPTGNGIGATGSKNPRGDNGGAAVSAEPTTRSPVAPGSKDRDTIV